MVPVHDDLGGRHILLELLPNQLANGLRFIALLGILMNGIGNIGLRRGSPKRLHLFRLSLYNRHELGLGMLWQRGRQKHHLHLPCR